MTTTAKTAANGAATDCYAGPAQREHGLDRLREDQCYHLSALIVACLSEAEHLVRKVNSKAFSRTLDHDGTKGSAPLNNTEIAQILTEARECTQAASDYLYQAVSTLRTRTRSHRSDLLTQVPGLGDGYPPARPAITPRPSQEQEILACPTLPASCLVA